MELELKIYRAIGHLLPRIPHASGVINRIFKPIYNRKPRKFVTVNVMGVLMELDPSEDVDGNLLFCPQLYDFQEMDFISKNLKDGDCFVDVGSHIGLYSLMASKYIRTGKIVSIEADPDTFDRLKVNMGLNNLTTSNIVNYGVSDKDEMLKLEINTHGNKGGQSFLRSDSDESVNVGCRPLLDILKEKKLPG